VNQTNTYIVINNIFVTKNKPVKITEIAKTLNISKSSKDKYKVTLLSNSTKNCGVAKSSLVAKKKGQCKGEIKVTYANGKTKTQRFQLQVKI
jgi:predicted transcriptional regulator